MAGTVFLTKWLLTRKAGPPAAMVEEYNVIVPRNTVKNATRGGGAAVNYLTNPDNISAFMNKPVVQRALDNPAVVQAAVSSGLMSAILDTPGGRSLMNDPAAMRDIIAANPDLTNLLANPNVVNALLNNPRTAGLLGLIGPPPAASVVLQQFLCSSRPVVAGFSLRKTSA